MSWTAFVPFIVSTLKIVLKQVDPATPAGKLAALALLLLNQLSPAALAVHGPDHVFAVSTPIALPQAPYTEESLTAWADAQPVI